MHNRQTTAYRTLLLSTNNCKCRNHRPASANHQPRWSVHGNPKNFISVFQKDPGFVYRQNLRERRKHNQQHRLPTDISRQPRAPDRRTHIDLFSESKYCSVRHERSDLTITCEKHSRKKWPIAPGSSWSPLPPPGFAASGIFFEVSQKRFSVSWHKAVGQLKSPWGFC